MAAQDVAGESWRKPEKQPEQQTAAPKKLTSVVNRRLLQVAICQPLDSPPSSSLSLQPAADSRTRCNDARHLHVLM